MNFYRYTHIKIDISSVQVGRIVLTQGGHSWPEKDPGSHPPQNYVDGKGDILGHWSGTGSYLLYYRQVVHH